MQVQATSLLQFITVVECRLRQAHRRGFWASHPVRSPMRLVPVLEELLSSRARIHRLFLVVRPSYPTLIPCRLLRILLGGGLCLLLADLTSPALVPHSIDSKSLILYGGGASGQASGLSQPVSDSWRGCVGKDPFSPPSG